MDGNSAYRTRRFPHQQEEETNAQRSAEPAPCDEHRGGGGAGAGALGRPALQSRLTLNPLTQNFPRGDFIEIRRSLLEELAKFDFVDTSGPEWLLFGQFGISCVGVLWVKVFVPEERQAVFEEMWNHALDRVFAQARGGSHD